MMALICTNAAIMHDRRCPVCGSSWRLTPAQVEQLGLEAGLDLGGAA
jgi:hypothetical protein